MNLVTDIKYPGGVMNYFYYDALLRRYAMEDSSGLRYFTWDTNGMNLLAERDASGDVIAYYTHGYSVVDGVGTMIAAKRNEAGTSYYQYPIYDMTGDVVRLVDQTGAPTAYYEYDAWGNVLREDVVDGTGTNRFRANSNYIDLPDSGGELDLSPTRLRHKPTGRWLQRDPSGDLAGAYLYCNAEPIDCVDPDGLAERAATGKSAEKSRFGQELKAKNFTLKILSEKKVETTRLGISVYLGITVSPKTCEKIYVQQFVRTTAVCEGKKKIELPWRRDPNKPNFVDGEAWEESAWVSDPYPGAANDTEGKGRYPLKVAGRPGEGRWTFDDNPGTPSKLPSRPPLKTTFEAITFVCCEKPSRNLGWFSWGFVDDLKAWKVTKLVKVTIGKGALPAGLPPKPCGEWIAPPIPKIDWPLPIILPGVGPVGGLA